VIAAGTASPLREANGEPILLVPSGAGASPATTDIRTGQNPASVRCISDRIAVAMKNFRERRGFPERNRSAPRPYAGGREHTGPDVVFGVEPVRELIAAAPNSIETLHVRAGEERRFADEVERVRAAGGRIAIARDSEIDRIVGRDARHQGVAATVREYQYAGLDAVIAAAPDPIVLVDGVTDPRNLGALLRSAEGAGIGAVVLARDHTVGITPAAVKSSAGAWVHLKIARCGNVARTLEMLKEAGYWVVALAPGGDVSLYDLDTSRKLVIVMGSEGEGVRPIVRKTADFVVSIPMRGKVDSLNVSVAAAVALFEIARKRASAS
jgi:23S rRNA (guanosine2251-2'-O)-methyltransferase